jgi:hypothetical protein
MHDHTSQETFDDLHASVNIDTDIASEDASVFIEAASDHTNTDSLLKDDKELSTLVGMLATTSSRSKKPKFTMPATFKADLPPPVRFCRTNRNQMRASD